MIRGRQSGCLHTKCVRDKAGLKSSVKTKPKNPALIAEAGLVLVLLEPALQILACDGGAATILNHRHPLDGKAGSVPNLPEEILEILRELKPGDQLSLKIHLRLENEYTCRMYSMESHNGFMTQPIVALHLERDSSANDAIRDIVNKYHLTGREQEVLRGISRGLATKELAEQMHISPNTVKAFLRLVMIKMGVTKRAGIVAKILHNGAAADEVAALPD